MRDADLEIARLVTHVGVLEQQLDRAKRDRDAALSYAARLGRLYGATRGLRTEAARQIELEAYAIAADCLSRAALTDAEWDATKPPESRTRAGAATERRFPGARARPSSRGAGGRASSGSDSACCVERPAA